MLRDGLRTFLFQKMLDHLLAFLMIFLLMALAVRCFGSVKSMVEVCARFASQDDLRLDVHYHYALTGEWPGDSVGLMRTRPKDVSYRPYDGDEVSLEDGAIHIRPTRGNIADEIISLRPVVPAGDPCGPIGWVVGEGPVEGGRLIQGNNATTIGRHLIPNNGK
jgi:hypothetical protein